MVFPMEGFVDDTICAVATPVGEGGVGIIRVSGSHAIDVASHVIRPRNRQSLHQLDNHRLYVSDIVYTRHPSPAGRGQEPPHAKGGGKAPP